MLNVHVVHVDKLSICLCTSHVWWLTWVSSALSQVRNTHDKPDNSRDSDASLYNGWVNDYTCRIQNDVCTTDNNSMKA